MVAPAQATIDTMNRVVWPEVFERTDATDALVATYLAMPAWKRIQEIRLLPDGTFQHAVDNLRARLIQPATEGQWRLSPDGLLLRFAGSHRTFEATRMDGGSIYVTFPAGSTVLLGRGWGVTKRAREQRDARRARNGNSR